MRAFHAKVIARCVPGTEMGQCVWSVEEQERVIIMDRGSYQAGTS